MSEISERKFAEFVCAIKHLFMMLLILFSGVSGRRIVLSTLL